MHGSVVLQMIAAKLKCEMKIVLRQPLPIFLERFINQHVDTFLGVWISLIIVLIKQLKQQN